MTRKAYLFVHPIVQVLLNVVVCMVHVNQPRVCVYATLIGLEQDVTNLTVKIFIANMELVIHHLELANVLQVKHNVQC